MWHFCVSSWQPRDHTTPPMVPPDCAWIEMWFPGQKAKWPQQFPRVRRHSMKWADGYLQNKSPCKIWMRLRKICHGGARFGRRVGLHPQSSNPRIGFGQVSQHVDAWQQVHGTGHRDGCNASIRSHRLVLVDSGKVVESSPRVRVEPAVDAGTMLQSRHWTQWSQQESPVLLRLTLQEITVMVLCRTQSPSESDQPETPADSVIQTVEEVEVEVPQGPRLREASLFLDTVDPMRIFRQRRAVMKYVPHFVKGPFRNTLKVALEEASTQDGVCEVRGWKLLIGVAPEVWCRSRNWLSCSNSSHRENGKVC